MRNPFGLNLAVLAGSLAALPAGTLQAQAPGTVGHEHLGEVACVDVPQGTTRPSSAASTSAR
jgi:hypothetical protein